MIPGMSYSIMKPLRASEWLAVARFSNCSNQGPSTLASND
jgi:hypothetical protein